MARTAVLQPTSGSEITQSIIAEDSGENQPTEPLPLHESGILGQLTGRRWAHGIISAHKQLLTAKECYSKQPLSWPYGLAWFTQFRVLPIAC